MKLKLIFYIITLIFSTQFTQGQNCKRVKKIEIELSIGTTLGVDKFVGNKKIGPSLALEGRYNFQKQPIDIGLELYIGSAVRNFKGEDLSNRIFSSIIFSDYNFCRGSNISPFVGIGIGTASCDIILGSFGDSGMRGIFSPRVGIEFFRHLRLTCYSKLCMKGYNNVGISIGYAFGGGLKK